MRVRYFYLIPIVQAAYIVVNRYLSDVGNGVMIFCKNHLVHYYKPIIHLTEILHVSRNVVLDVLYTAYLVYHEFVYGISDDQLTLCLDIG